MTFSYDYADLKEVLESNPTSFDKKYQITITDANVNVITTFENTYTALLAIIDAMPETTDQNKIDKWQAYIDLYNGDYSIAFAGNFSCWYIDTTVDFVYNKIVYTPGQLVYWYYGALYSLDNIEVTPVFTFEKKFLSVLVSKFFNNEQFEQYPDFVEFLRTWLRYLETDVNADGNSGAYAIISKINSYADVDTVPDVIILEFMKHYASVFSSDEVLNAIDYFTSAGVVNYEHVRYFLRISRLWFNSKANINSIFVIYRMLQKNLRIRYTARQLLKCSAYENHSIYAYSSASGALTVTDDYWPVSYISAKATDTDLDLLFHTHGQDLDTDRHGAFDDKIIWGYYGLIFDTDHDIYQSKLLLRRVVQPTGIAYYFKQFDYTITAGWGTQQFGSDTFGTVPVVNTYQNIQTIDGQNLTVKYLGLP